MRGSPFDHQFVTSHLGQTPITKGTLSMYSVNFLHGQIVMGVLHIGFSSRFDFVGHTF